MRKLYRTVGVAIAIAFSAGVLPSATAATSPEAPAWEEVEAPKEITIPKGIGVVNDQDVWAFGNGKDKKAISSHWDGKTWTTVPIPEFTELATFAARSTDDIWIGGRNFNTSAKYLAHWDGKSWTAVDPFQGSDASGDYDSMVNDVTFLDGDVWVGGGCCGKPGWLTRWDGQQWHEVKVPSGDAQNPHKQALDLAYPEGLVTTKSGELVATGMRRGETMTALLLRGNKDGLTQQQPPQGSEEHTIWRAGTLDGETLYAAGFSQDADMKIYPVIYRWDGSKWSAEKVTAKGECALNSMARAGNSLYTSSENSVGPACTFRLNGETSQWEEIPSHGISANGFNPAIVIDGSDNSDTLWAFGENKEGTHVKQYRP